MIEWIDIKDHFPEPGEIVIVVALEVYDQERFVGVAKYEGSGFGAEYGEWYFLTGLRHDHIVIHWACLPAPPTETLS